ncbi:hypothetical protein BD560DRAFT_442136 [Blakeslea trispora]|nr:hypothetical protein BD560DRAFT_442136 [Blakeslea trispora]
MAITLNHLSFNIVFFMIIHCHLLPQNTVLQFEEILTILVAEAQASGVDTGLFDFITECKAKIAPYANNIITQWKHVTIKNAEDINQNIDDFNDIAIFAEFEEGSEPNRSSSVETRATLGWPIRFRMETEQGMEEISYFPIAFLLRHVDHKERIILCCINQMENSDGALWSLVEQDRQKTISFFRVMSIVSGESTSYFTFEGYEEYRDFVPCAVLLLRSDVLNS